MMKRKIAAGATAFLLMIQAVPELARADNQMGYQLLSVEEAAGLPNNHGALGLDVERSQSITDSGMTFAIIRIKQVRRGSPGAQAGLNRGDQIIAVDGRVFPSVRAFAAYVGSRTPGRQVNMDYIPARGGPADAERVVVTVGGAGGSAQPPTQMAQDQAPAQTGMSTRTKIGIGAAALLGCYALGCFSHR